MMLGEESSSATYWKQCGDEALEHGVKGIVIMVWTLITLQPDVILHITKSEPNAGCSLGLLWRPNPDLDQSEPR